MKACGLKPDIEVIEEITGDWPWQEAERFWIKKSKDAGFNLTNNTSGGDGVCDLPEHTREKMRRTWLGRKHKPETLIKLSATSKGRKKTDEMKEAMSIKMKAHIVQLARTATL